MKGFLQEYGKVVIGGLIAGICFVLLMSTGGVTSFAGGLRPENPAVENPAVSGMLDAMAKRKAPTFQFGKEWIELGETVCLKDLILGVKDGEGNDLKERVRYFLEGKEMAGDYPITPEEPGILNIAFQVEDTWGTMIRKKYKLKVEQVQQLPDATDMLAKYDIGVGEDVVWAAVYKDEDEMVILSMEGRGRAQEFSSPKEVPWKEYRGQITECLVAKDVRIENMDYWFYGCGELKMAPEVNGVISMTSTFEGCRKLKTAWIPEGVQNLTRTFRDCISLTWAPRIPASVVNVMEAFSGCVALSGDMVFEGIPSYGAGCFRNVASQTKGVWLQVWTRVENTKAVEDMILEERNRGNKSVVFKGIRRGVI